MCAREEMAREYSNADCFALASRCETFGVAYAEAMAAGLPVIATRCGGPEDFVNSNCGLLVKTDDDEAMAEAMADMVSNSKSRYSPSAIRAQVESSFAPEVIAGELIDVYKRQVEGWLAKRKPAV
jgi:glycosyltransferase involved in cell wall biosynthesis